jgi:hypothetical protein
MCPLLSQKVLKLNKMSSVTSVLCGKYKCELCGYQTLKKTHLKLHEQEAHVQSANTRQQRKVT